MYKHLYQNSYIVAITVFIILIIIFYVFEIGYTTQITDTGQIEKKFSWKIPAAIALIVWVIIHFYVYPPYLKTPEHTPSSNSTINNTKFPTINVDNWN
jgi:uncharacterized membrane protein (DUF485 family)